MCGDSCWWLADTRIERRRPLSSSGSLASPALWRIMHPSDKSNICSTHLVAHTTRLAELYAGADAEVLEYKHVDGLECTPSISWTENFAAKNKSFTMQTPTYAQAYYYSWIQRQPGRSAVSAIDIPHICASHALTTVIIGCFQPRHIMELWNKSIPSLWPLREGISVYMRVYLCCNICTGAFKERKICICSLGNTMNNL